MSNKAFSKMNTKYSITMTATIVYHVSDIHIKFSMKDDVRGDIIYAFDQLIERISQEPQPVTVVITGDIYDTANRINPEELLTFHLIFNKLNSCDKIDHIITIPGNHDYLVDPENNIIFASLIASKYSKLHHYNVNSELTIGNVHYHVITHPRAPFPLFLENHETEKTRVVLLHETIRGAVLNGSYSYSGEGKSAADFANYHAVMLGDIHKQQSIERPTIAYAGSLIQRNFGEDMEHGALRWVLCGEDTSYEFIKFKLRRAYITFISHNNKVVSPPINKDLYEKVKKVRFIHSNCSPGYVEKAMQTIRAKYGRLDYVLDDTPAFEISPTTETPEMEGSKEKSKLRGVDVNGIIMEYLNSMYPNNPTKFDITASRPSKNEVLRDRILKLHNEFMQSSGGSGKYKLLTLAWDNVFCYGPGNFVDFTKLNGVVSIIGKNGVGKSSIIGILFYVLYDEKFGCNEILNTSQETYKITCTFSVLGDVYKVQKSNSGKGGTTALEIYKNDKLLKYGSIPDKNRALREILGSHTNLSRNNIARQVHEMYLDKSQNSFYEELVNYLDLGEYVQIPNKIKEIVKPIKANIASLDAKIKNNTKDSDQLESLLPKEQAKLDELKTALNTVVEEQNAVNRKYVRVSGNSDSVHRCFECPEVTLEEIDVLQKSISGLYKGEYLPTDMTPDECRAKIALVMEDIQKYTNSISKLNEMLTHFRNSLASSSVTAPTNKYPKEVVVQREAELNNYMPSQISEYRTTLLDVRKKLKEKIETVKSLEAQIQLESGRLTDVPEDQLTVQIRELEVNDKYKFSGKCECCVYNMKLMGQDAETIKKLYNDIAYFQNFRVRSQIADVCVPVTRKEYDRLLDIITLYDSNEYYNHEQITLRMNKIKTEITSHEANLLELNMSLTNHKKHLVYAQNAETIKAQKDLADKICCYNNCVTVEGKLVGMRFTKCMSTVKTQEDIITKLINEISTVKKYESYREQRYELESQLTVYQEYEKFVNIKTGIPAIIVKHYIPVLEKNINEILDKIVDFRIAIDSETHKITNASNGVLAVQFSGSQKFVTDIIIRLCLINNHPNTPNFMIIDEGFGSLDSESLVDMCGFMEKIGNYVNLDFMIIISHIEDLNQIAKTRLVIECEDGYSRITYT
jgi:DNA repair exonuclease SbcCD ATPase subunit/metallophosphoesterase superfamily enzyme